MDITTKRIDAHFEVRVKI